MKIVVPTPSTKVVVPTGSIKLFRGMSITDFLLGTAATMVVGSVARPLLVSAVRGGLQLTGFVTGIVTDAMTEVNKIKAEAATGHPPTSGAVMADVMAEIQKLRAEVAAAKASPTPASSGKVA